MKTIDLAANLAKKNFKSKNFTFHELLDLIKEKNPSWEVDIGDLYINVIEDVRFLSIGAQKWRLHENLKYEEVKKIRMAMFGDKQYYGSDLEEENEQNEVILDEYDDLKNELDEKMINDIEIIDIDMKDSLVEEEEEEEENKEEKYEK